MSRGTTSPQSSEVDAYLFIRDNLKAIGWDTRNPARHTEGQVYTQAECLSHPEIKKQLGLDKPENIIKISESTFWVIEAKRAHKQIKQAVDEARDYAAKINCNKVIQALFISGVAGNETDGYLVRTFYRDNGQYKPITINGKETSALISPELVRLVLDGGPDIADIPVNEALFLSKAERINEILHLGAINKNYRARVMAALLLTFVEDMSLDIDAPPSVLISDINSRAKRVLTNQGKPEFYPYIELSLPATEDNHFKFKAALVQTYQELNNLNIRSAMNSGTDVLGKFYEVFLKYGNGAKEIGIVLTPHHITHFAAEVLNITDRDIIYDPACGTGGFLVSAFDAVRQTHNKAQVDRFKENNLFGVEQEPEVVALAIVNMIFRGDGKTNIIEGNCFQRHLVRATRAKSITADYVKEKPDDDELAVTRVMMNPPFALKRSDEKEFKFVDYALGQMQDGGLLFSVLPYAAMVKPGAYKRWRERLLKDNTLLAVVTFPHDLFYPVGVHTVGIFVRKGMPHPESQNVLWIRALNDGLLKSKGKRLPHPKAMNDIVEVEPLVRTFLADPSYSVPNIFKFQKATPIELGDPFLELVPEVYLDQESPTEDEIEGALESDLRQSLSYLIKTERAVIRPEFVGELVSLSPVREPYAWMRFTAEDMFELGRGHFHSISDLDEGAYPTISRVSTDNGFVGFYDKPDGAEVMSPGIITVSTVEGDAFLQPVPFIATDNVVLCVPKREYAHLSFASLFFVATMLNGVKWRYSYGRQCYKTKFAKTEFLLPITESESLDEEYMEALVTNREYWRLFEAAIAQNLSTLKG